MPRKDESWQIMHPEPEFGIELRSYVIAAAILISGPMATAALWVLL